MPATITFRTKVRTITFADGSDPQPCIDYKRAVDRRDCSMRPHEHTFYNSDMFPLMLQRAYDVAIRGRKWCRLNELPPSVVVDTSKFLANVTVTLPDSFR